MKMRLRQHTRGVYLVIALALLGVSSLPLLSQKALAASQVTFRSIELSNSTQGATGVTYTVKFTPATSVAAGGGIVVDFCDLSPIIGDTTCGLPGGSGTNFDLGGSTPTVSGYSGMGGSGWTVSGVQGDAASGKSQVLELTSTTGTLTAGIAASFSITSVTNPGIKNHSFYGRILTFDTAAHMTAQYTVSTNTRGSSFANMVDYGGVALSTADVISITAKVMESLTFCVSGQTIASGCGGALTTPSVNLGRTVGLQQILDNQSTYINDAYTQTSTNAQHGVIVRMKDTSSANCGGLSNDGGTTCLIAAQNTGTTASPAAATIPAGQALFGMCVTPGTANTSAYAPYNGTCTGTGTTDTFGLDDTSGPGTGTNVRSTYGSPIFQSTGAVNQENDTLEFGASAALTTPAGIYTANYALVATGTY